MSPVEQSSLPTLRPVAERRLLAVAKLAPQASTGAQTLTAAASGAIKHAQTGARLALIALLWLGLGIAAGLSIR